MSRLNRSFKYWKGLLRALKGTEYIRALAQNKSITIYEDMSHHYRIKVR